MLLKQEYLNVRQCGLTPPTPTSIIFFLPLITYLYIYLCIVLYLENYKHKKTLKTTFLLIEARRGTMTPQPPPKIILIGISLDPEDSKQLLSWAIETLAHETTPSWPCMFSVSIFRSTYFSLLSLSIC